ncbi:hypothetical protein MPTK1_2g15580 [Marchantia polymorpha subsp. ruderalis]|uniref:Uncharacterized protein n=1 Tax=Marchantia polymorpha TaxID=3197 RepID=A0A2R6WK27_MARPO|nr:hypothetical protein MARPO_0082s0055 [Marchantia polymorpha]BBN02468.1 hypothetical protein Mp_2g15580 [Marchantia polymorpha subsp. ruderalis]|eukprot:PTQ34216.1 hypothetical protein MARPO_0082s0055 [Marchantia polymorpha]
MRHGMEGRSTYREQPNYARGSSLFTAHSNHSHDDHRPLSTHKARRSVWPRLASSRLLAPGLSACPTSCSSLRPDHALGRFPCRTLSATRARRPRPPNRLARQKILYSNLFCSIARCPSPDAAALINPALRSPSPPPLHSPAPRRTSGRGAPRDPLPLQGFAYVLPRTPYPVPRSEPRSGPARPGPVRPGQLVPLSSAGSHAATLPCPRRTTVLPGNAPPGFTLSRIFGLSSGLSARSQRLDRISEFCSFLNAGRRNATTARTVFETDNGAREYHCQGVINMTLRAS